MERRLHAGQSTPAGQAFRCRPPANTGRPRLSVPTAYIGRTSLSTQAVRVVSAGLPDYSRGRIAGTRVQDRQHRQDKPFDVGRLHWQLKPVSGSCESRAFANPHGSLEVVRRAATPVRLEVWRSSSSLRNGLPHAFMYIARCPLGGGSMRLASVLGGSGRFQTSAYMKNLGDSKHQRT